MRDAFSRECESLLLPVPCLQTMLAAHDPCSPEVLQNERQRQCCPSRRCGVCVCVVCVWCVYVWCGVGRGGGVWVCA